MVGMTTADPLTDLQAKIAELESMDLEKLQTRTALFPARIELEDLTENLAEELDVDGEIVLLVTRAAWSVRLNVETAGEDVPEPTEFVTRVEADVRTTLTALGDGVTETGNAVIDRVLSRTLELAKAGVKIIPVREIMDRTKCMIGNRV